MLLGQQVEVETQLFFNLTLNYFAIKAMEQARYCNFYDPLRPCQLSSLQYSRNRLGNASPVGGFRLKLFSPRSCQFVEFSPAIVFRNVPFRGNPTPIFHAIERGVEGAIFDFQ